MAKTATFVIRVLSQIVSAFVDVGNQILFDLQLAFFLSVVLGQGKDSHVLQW